MPVLALRHRATLPRQWQLALPTPAAAGVADNEDVRTAAELTGVARTPAHQSTADASVLTRT
jgi:hypothetical protein